MGAISTPASSAQAPWSLGPADPSTQGSCAPHHCLAPTCGAVARPLGTSSVPDPGTGTDGPQQPPGREIKARDLQTGQQRGPCTQGGPSSGQVTPGVPGGRHQQGHPVYRKGN